MEKDKENIPRKFLSFSEESARLKALYDAGVIGPFGLYGCPRCDIVINGYDPCPVCGYGKQRNNNEMTLIDWLAEKD
jgi:rubrerythrin